MWRIRLMAAYRLQCPGNHGGLLASLWRLQQRLGKGSAEAQQRLQPGDYGLPLAGTKTLAAQGFFAARACARSLAASFLFLSSGLISLAGGQRVCRRGNALSLTRSGEASVGQASSHSGAWPVDRPRFNPRRVARRSRILQLRTDWPLSPSDRVACMDSRAVALFG